jgi:HK97 family phage major capsid protein
VSYADLIKKLQETRAALITEMGALLKAPDGTEKRSLSTEEKTAWDAKDGEVRELDAQIGRYQQQDEREKRAAAARAQTGDTGPDAGRAGGAQVISEPQVYGRGSGHSYFLDEARATLGVGDGDGGVKAARDRQARHEAELRVEMPRRREARKREAEQRMEAVLSGAENTGSPSRQLRRLGRREQRIYERFLAEGMRVFEQGSDGGREQRFISRTDGQGGYFVPPLWLVDEYIPYLRAGRTFADLWRNFPLPGGTDSINIPRVTLGTATGPQQGDGGPVPGRDMTDNFVNARVATIAGQQDAAIQLLDQSPIAFDEIIFGDLAADYNMQLSAQLMLGSGFPQINGLYPTGVLYGASIGTTGATANGFYTAATGLTTAQWAGTASFYQASAQLMSLISRNRFIPPDHLITNPAAWYALSSSVDTTGRPLVVPAMQGNNFNQLASDDDGPRAEGPVGRVLGVPWSLDPNIPLTFGGTGATQPSIGVISNGSTAPVPGSGGTSTNANVFTPAIAALFSDLFLWEGEMRSRTLSEVLSGTLQVRFQLYAYVASMLNRYQNASNQPVSYGNVNSVGTLGAALSQGAAGGLLGF